MVAAGSAAINASDAYRPATIAQLMQIMDGFSADMQGATVVAGQGSGCATNERLRPQRPAT